MTGPDVDELQRRVDRLEDLLAGIATLAGRAGDPIDLSEWPGDLGESDIRRVRQMESSIRCIVALADLERIDRDADWQGHQ